MAPMRTSSSTIGFVTYSSKPISRYFSPIAGHGMGGQRNNGEVTQLLLRPDPLEDLGTVHARQRDVEQNEVGNVIGQAVHDLHSILVLGDLVLVLENGLNEEAIVYVVLYDCDLRLHSHLP